MTAATGTVERFDRDEGLGVLALDDGRRVGFHATQLADGTRDVAVGARVTADVVPWHRGELEATNVRVVGPGGGAGC